MLLVLPLSLKRCRLSRTLSPPALSSLHRVRIGTGRHLRGNVIGYAGTLGFETIDVTHFMAMTISFLNAENADSNVT